MPSSIWRHTSSLRLNNWQKITVFLIPLINMLRTSLPFYVPFCILFHNAKKKVYRVAQKSKPQSFVNILANYWPIFKIFSQLHSWQICSKVVTKHTRHTFTVSLHYLVKCKLCKIHHYLVNIWTRVWSLIFGPSCMTVSSFYVSKHRMSI